MSGPEDTPPDFGKVVENAREESERQAAEMLARLKPPTGQPAPMEPLAED